MVNAQELINKEFSDAEKKSKVKEISFSVFPIGTFGSLEYMVVNRKEIEIEWTSKEVIENVKRKYELDFSFDTEIGIFTCINYRSEGELLIENLPNLEKLIITDQKITSLEVNNCPNLKFFNCSYNNDLIHLKINCPSLETWQLDNNHFLKKLKHSEMPHLTNFFCKNFSSESMISARSNSLLEELKKENKVNIRIKNWYPNLEKFDFEKITNKTYKLAWETKTNWLIELQKKIDLLEQRNQETQKEIISQKKHSQHRIQELNKKLNNKEKENKELKEKLAKLELEAKIEIPNK